jgi:hypothetical protein
MCLIFEVSTMPNSVLVGYERASFRPYIPSSMRCFRCQSFGYTQQKCILSLVCGDYDETGHEEAPWPRPLKSASCSGAHASGDRNCPVYRDERAIQELRVMEGLSFQDVRKKFLETKPKTGTQSYSSTLRRPRGVVAISQTEAIYSQTKQSSPSVPSWQTEVSTESDDPSNPAVPGTVHDTSTSRALALARG